MTTSLWMKELLFRKNKDENFWGIRDISLEIKQGERVGLVGKNGSGKTTLLKVLSGIYKETQGSYFLQEEPKVLFNSFAGFFDYLSVLDNVFLFGGIQGLSRKFLKERCHDILKSAELETYREAPFKDLSLGQKKRLALSIFFLLRNKILFFDEVLDFLDPSFLKRFEHYFLELERRGVTSVLVSHQLEFMEKNCDRIVWFDNGKVQAIGDPKEVLVEYLREL